MLLRYLFLAGIILPSPALAADYIEDMSSDTNNRMCHIEQNGARYCTDVPPIEKRVTDCDAGVDCHHMQSGQHYSLQRPLTVE